MRQRSGASKLHPHDGFMEEAQDLPAMRDLYLFHVSRQTPQVLRDLRKLAFPGWPSHKPKASLSRELLGNLEQRTPARAQVQEWATRYGLLGPSGSVARWVQTAVKATIEEWHYDPMRARDNQKRDAGPVWMLCGEFTHAQREPECKPARQRRHVLNNFQGFMEQVPSSFPGVCFRESRTPYFPFSRARFGPVQFFSDAVLAQKFLRLSVFQQP